MQRVPSGLRRSTRPSACAVSSRPPNHPTGSFDRGCARVRRLAALVLDTRLGGRSRRAAASRPDPSSPVNSTTRLPAAACAGCGHAQLHHRGVRGVLIALIAPCARTFGQIGRSGSTRRSGMLPESVPAPPQAPADLTLYMHGGISALHFCAASVAGVVAAATQHLYLRRQHRAVGRVVITPRANRVGD